MFIDMGLLTKSGNRYLYVDIDTGEEHLDWEKNWQKNVDNKLTMIMDQFYRHPLVAVYNSGPEDDDNKNEILSEIGELETEE